MRQNLEILVTSFKMAVLELWKNKLRAFLSLFGVTIGIFCIIGVLATVNSLEHNIQKEIKSLGTNTIYIDKWDYGASTGGDYPWWKFVNRPAPRYSELELIKERTASAQYAAFKMNITGQVEAGSNVLNGVVIYGISEEFSLIQPFEVQWGRALTEAEYEQGSSAAVIGFEVAEKLFGEPSRAAGKIISIKGRKLPVAGVIKKQGAQMMGGWQLDNCVLLNYKFARSMMNELQADPLVLVQGKDQVPTALLIDDLTGAMRSIRKLSPVEEDNFSLNDINEFSEAAGQIFSSINLGGWAIAALSLIVGMFGVANIMFVTVKERTAQIGLKKAIGAKSRTILTEFLMESAFLCIIGGMVGLLLVFILTKIVSNLLDFPIFISTANMLLAIGICIVVGVLAGIIPASQAAKMNPVVAIRS
jgi:putative ABC transport system permease protein